MNDDARWTLRQLESLRARPEVIERVHARRLASRRAATVAVVVVVVARRLVPRMSRPSRYQTSALSQMGVKCLQYYTTSRDQRGTGVHFWGIHARASPIRHHTSIRAR